MGVYALLPRKQTADAYNLVMHFLVLYEKNLATITYEFYLWDTSSMFNNGLKNFMFQQVSSPSLMIHHDCTLLSIAKT